MKAHVISDGLITNTIEVDSLDFMPNLIDATSGKIGDGYVNGVIVPHTPAVPVPQSVTRAQAKLALLQAGLLGSIQPAIDAISDATQRTASQIEWDDRLTFERSNGTLVTMATALGMTDAQIDALFIAAATL